MSRRSSMVVSQPSLCHREYEQAKRTSVNKIRMISIDGERARKYAQLSGLDADLDEALEAFERAIDLAVDAGGVTRRLLINAGVVAYWRCFNRQGGMPSLVDLVPDHLSAQHERSRQWRNRMVAHADSLMRATRTVLVVEQTFDAYVIRSPLAFTASIDPPDFVIDEQIQLIESMRAIVAAERSPLAAAVSASFDAESLAELWSRDDDASETSTAAVEWTLSRSKATDFVPFTIKL